MRKIVHQYDQNGYFAGLITLDDSDLSPSGRWNIPAGCTDKPLPEEQDGCRPRWNGEDWEQEEIPLPPAPPEPTLDESKQQKIAELKAERDSKEVLPIHYNGNNFDYDEKARDRISAAIIALELQGEGASLEWTTADNTDVPVTANDLKGVIAAVAVRSNALHIAYRQAKAKVQAAKTPEELEEI